MTTEDRRVGKLLPSPVVPETTVCFTIVVPNAVQYRAALLGQLSVLGDWHTWDHPTDGTNCLDCEQAAQLWRNALYNAVWSEECEEIVDCNDVANCIDTDFGVQVALANAIETSTDIQQALAQQMGTNAGITSEIYNTTVIGSPMTSAGRNTGVSSSGVDCDPDALFGSITEILMQLHTNNEDFLELMELSTNGRERIAAVWGAIPLLNEIPIDDAFAFVDKMQAEIQENYDAQWTTSLKDQYRCDLFCLVKDRPGCELTFQDMVVYWNNRIGTAIEPVNFFGALVQYFISGTWSGSTVVDIMMLIQLSVWQQASSWTGITLRQLETVGLLGANNPDPDWTILCEECGENCGPAWPMPIAFYQGNITNVTGDVYSVSLVTDPVPGFRVIRTSQYGNWTKGNFTLEFVEIIGAQPFQIYAERDTGTVLYDGKSVAALNALLPACIRYIQFIKRTDTGEFSVKMTIDN